MNALAQVLHAAVNALDPTLVRALLAHPDAAFTQDDLGHALCATCRRTSSPGRIADIVSVLLAEIGPDVGVHWRDPREGHSENTPLYYAAKKNSVAAAALLLINGADVNFRNLRGRTPLIAASYENHVEVATLLLDRGAEIDATSHGSGYSALHVACRRGAVCTARVLLDRGADVSKQSVPNGNTPLHVAACAGQEDIVRLLLTYPNIDVDLGNINLGKTPLIAAAEQGHCLVVARLLAGGADCRRGHRRSDRSSYVTPLYAACRSGRLEVVRLLLAHISSHGLGTGTGPLRSACSNGHVETVRALLDFGMSPFQRAVSGKTAFDYARPHPPVARLLRPRILVVVRTCVLGTAAEYPCRNRLRDLVPHVASYIV